jgi:hypothetical protein
MEVYSVNGLDIFDDGPREAAEQWMRMHGDGYEGVVTVRDREGLIVDEWEAEYLRENY